MKKLIPILLILVLLLCACGQEAAGGGSAQPAQSGEQTAAAESAGDHTVITLSGSSAKISGGGARDEGDAVTISAAGTYEVTGSGSKMLAVIAIALAMLNVAGGFGVTHRMLRMFHHRRDGAKTPSAKQ